MDQLKLRLISAAMSLERLGLSKIGPGKGSFSARDDKSGNILITPSAKPYSSVSPDELVIVDSNGNSINEKKPSVDLIFHRAIYNNREDINAVAHLHSPYATAYALLHKEIPVYMQVLANIIGSAVPVSDFALPGTQELGENIVRAMAGSKNAVLMANHGLVVCAATPEECAIIASTVEDAAQATAFAQLLGSPVELSQEQILGARGFYKKNF